MMKEFKKWLNKAEKINKNGTIYYIVCGEFMTKEEALNCYQTIISQKK